MQHIIPKIKSSVTGICLWCILLLIKLQLTTTCMFKLHKKSSALTHRVLLNNIDHLCSHQLLSGGHTLNKSNTLTAMTSRLTMITLQYYTREWCKTKRLTGENHEILLEKNCWTWQLNKQDAADHNQWRKLLLIQYPINTQNDRQWVVGYFAQTVMHKRLLN